LVARLHWLGKRRLAAESNATNFMSIWRSPQSATMEARILDKLSTAPWRLWRTNTPLSNAPVTLLRPLLDDVVQAESYVEVRAPTNQPGELVFAIRLETGRAVLWQTNLPVILKSLAPDSNVSPDQEPKSGNSGFAITLQDSTFRIQLTRSADWLLLAMSDANRKQQRSTLLTDLESRIGDTGDPYPAEPTNAWLEIQAVAPALSDALQLGWKLPPTFPGIELTLTGDGQNVRTRGELNFPQPLPELLTPWRVPLNLTAEPLIGLTVVRSLPSLLEPFGMVSSGLAREFPAQFLVWLRAGPPLQIYFACPTANATNAFWQLAPPIMDWVNSHTDTRIYGVIALDTNRSELKWNRLSLCSPFLRTGTNAESQYLQGGFGLQSSGKVHLPKELHDHITQATNLVYFDWEFTGQTLPQWRYFDDVSRMIFDQAHASRLRAAPVSIDWLVHNITNLSHSVTELRQSTANQLLLTRKSTLGFTALELDVLINWIELPEFPRGMSSLWRTNATPFTPFHKQHPSTGR